MSTLLTKLSRPEGGCASDLRLDQLLALELPGPEAHALREHAAACARCGPRLAEREAERAHFAEEAAAWRAPQAASTPRRWALPGALVAAAAAALLLVRLPSAPDAEEGLRSKGPARVGFYVQSAGVLRKGGPQERVSPGDTLQFVTSLRAERHVAVLSLDGANRASVFYPDAPRTALQPAGEALPLPLSTVLDATPGRERVYVLLCTAPLELSPLLRALEAQPSRAPAPAGCEVQAIVLDKEPHR